MLPYLLLTRLRALAPKALSLAWRLSPPGSRETLRAVWESRRPLCKRRSASLHKVLVIHLDEAVRLERSHPKVAELLCAELLLRTQGRFESFVEDLQALLWLAGKFRPLGAPESGRLLLLVVVVVVVVAAAVVVVVVVVVIIGRAVRRPRSGATRGEIASARTRPLPRTLLAERHEVRACRAPLSATKRASGASWQDLLSRLDDQRSSARICRVFLIIGVGRLEQRTQPRRAARGAGRACGGGPLGSRALGSRVARRAACHQAGCHAHMGIAASGASRGGARASGRDVADRAREPLPTLLHLFLAIRLSSTLGSRGRAREEALETSTGSDQAALGRPWSTRTSRAVMGARTAQAAATAGARRGALGHRGAAHGDAFAWPLRCTTHGAWGAQPPGRSGCLDRTFPDRSVVGVWELGKAHVEGLWRYGLLSISSSAAAAPPRGVPPSSCHGGRVDALSPLPGGSTE